MAGSWQGNGMGTAWYVCESAFNTAWERHGMCESAFNLLASEFGILILAHPVCKMQIIQEQKKVAL
jgi:hypothetical protein